VKDEDENSSEWTRRSFLEVGTIATAVIAGAVPLAAQPADTVPCSLTINQIQHHLELDPRVTLLDLLRERLYLTGTKKGCDHGQCGACTVLVDGVRINACLALAVSYDGASIITIEGLAQGDNLHPLQQAFLDHDGFQCGFCTSGQICSATAMLEEFHLGAPSAVTANISEPAKVSLDEAEVRERMAGNICRCGAYPNITAAILAVGTKS
jgi:xanthine dehydrogenase YagT iron-sulfur-binding subunit